MAVSLFFHACCHIKRCFSFIRAEGLIPAVLGNACVVTKGIKADCNHLMRTTYPDACVGVVDFAFAAESLQAPSLSLEKSRQTAYNLPPYAKK